MNTVTGPELAVALYMHGAYGIMHRFGTLEDLTENVVKAREPSPNTEFGVSVGVKDWAKTKNWLSDIIKHGIHSICIDVAHGHHSLVGEMIVNIKEWAVDRGHRVYIIAGNVATGQGFIDLANYGADAVRVGIGSGSACTTRETTGVGVPQLTAIMEAADFRSHDRFHDVSIIADGGIQSPGDIAKALAAGADAVMLGKMLAGADEAASPSVFGTKTYSGQSINGSNGARGAPEGITGSVLTTGPVGETIGQLVHYLRSSFSYVGATNLTEFRAKAEFIKVSPATHLESITRL